MLASAESCTRTTFYNGNGGGYTGSLPSGAENSFRWSTFMVNVKGTIKTVIALSPENKMYTNVYDNGAWKGWETLARSKYMVNKATTKADVLTVPKNGSATLPYSNFGTFTNGHVYTVAIIGDNPTWSYYGILFYSGSRTKIFDLNASYLSVTVTSSQFTISNLHAEYDQRLAVEVVGMY